MEKFIFMILAIFDNSENDRYRVRAHEPFCNWDDNASVYKNINDNGLSILLHNGEVINRKHLFIYSQAASHAAVKTINVSMLHD